MTPSRRSLLRGFLALPVAARFAPVAAPVLPTADLDLVAIMVAEHELTMRAAFGAMLAEYERQRVETIEQWMSFHV